MSTVGVVESLSRYPVKSMRGETVQRAFIGYAGQYGDRHYAFLNTAAPAGFPYLTGRDRAVMLLHVPRFRYPTPAAKPSNLEEAASSRSLDTGRFTVDRAHTDTCRVPAPAQAPRRRWLWCTSNLIGVAYRCEQATTQRTACHGQAPRRGGLAARRASGGTCRRSAPGWTRGSRGPRNRGTGTDALVAGACTSVSGVRAEAGGPQRGRAGAVEGPLTAGQFEQIPSNIYDICRQPRHRDKGETGND